MRSVGNASDRTVACMRPSVCSVCLRCCAAAFVQLELSPDNKSACITFFTYKNSVKVGTRDGMATTGEKNNDDGLGCDRPFFFSRRSFPSFPFPFPLSFSAFCFLVLGDGCSRMPGESELQRSEVTELRVGERHGRHQREPRRNEEAMERGKQGMVRIKQPRHSKQQKHDDTPTCCAHLCVVASAALFVFAWRFPNGLDTEGISLLKVHVDKAEFCPSKHATHARTDRMLSYEQRCTSVVRR